MNVLFLSTVYPTPTNTITGIFVHNQARQLTELGVTVKVVCPVAITPPIRLLKPHFNMRNSWRNWLSENWDIPEEYCLDGIKIYYPKWGTIPKAVINIEHLFQHLFMKRLIDSLWQSWKWDVIHAHFLTPNGITANSLAKKYGVPLFISCLGADLNFYAKHRSIQKKVKSTLQQADAIICKSEELKKTAISFNAPSRKIHVIHNGCNTDRFRPLSSSKYPREILYIGQFIHRKCLDLLLEAFRDMKDKSTRLRLIGQGELYSALVSMAHALGIQDQVIFNGPIDTRLIPDYMKRASVLCLPSISEGTPNVVMEALACAVPVVATRVGGIPEILPPSCGILIPPNDKAALREALVMALMNNWDVGHIRRFAERNLSSATQCKKILNIYRKIVIQPH